MPAVVSSKVWLEFEVKKIAEKEQVEKEKEERKRKRAMAKEEKEKKVKGKKSKPKEVNDFDEDWICKVCNMRYSSEIIKSLRRRWVECDVCKLQFHYKYIPKGHLNLYGLEEEDEDDEDVAFICHICVKDKSDDDLANLLEESSEDDD